MAGGRPRKLTPIEEKSIYHLRKSGVVPAEVAYKFGISTTTVFRIVKKIEKELGENNEQS